jgi:AraC family transcriptional regulator of arabinose operon
VRYSIFSNSFCPLLNILTIGYAKDPAVTCFGPGVRNSYIIHYVIKGAGYFNGNKVSKGQGFLITPAMKEHYYPDENDPWEFLWVISDDPKIAKLFDLFASNKHTKIFSFDYLDTIKETVDFLTENNQQKYNGYEMLESFLSFFKYQQKTSYEKESFNSADVYIEAAVNYIELNMQNNVSVYELTQFLGISQPYLFKIFKERFSLSPKQYILNQKLKRAKVLLTETNLSVSHIANSIGILDVLSFSKAFKQKTGLSPVNYRNQYKSD